jgi:hypothetical protein
VFLIQEGDNAYVSFLATFFRLAGNECKRKSIIIIFIILGNCPFRT